MRYNAYEFNDDDYVQILKSPASEWVIPSNTKPYQKIKATNYYNLEYQMPAYFIQYIAYCMHGGFPILIWDHTDIGFTTTTLAKRYSIQRDIVKDKNGFIQSPHYLET